MYFENSGALGSRGGSRMLVSLPGSFSKTIEHAGSIMSSCVAIWMGKSASGQPRNTGTAESPTMGMCTARV